MEALRQDVRYAARSLARNRGFAAVAVLTLALGIGATTAIFSAVHAILLRPLPYPDADRVTTVWLSNPEIERDVTSFPLFEDWREGGSAFESMAGFTPTNLTFTGDGDAEEYPGARVTAEFFRVLGVTPRLGQAIGEAHTRAGGHQVVVLSHRLWRQRFGEDPAVIGRSVLINDEPREVIGVMPQGFGYPEPADFWVPIAPATSGWEQLLQARSSLWLHVIGRLAPEAPVAGASAELNGVMDRAVQEDPGMAGWRVLLEPLHGTVVGDLRPALLILFGAVGFVLLIACANVANLLLARGAGRRRELAVRTAMGATRGRLARQVLTESVVLGVIGGVAGVALAVVGTALLISASPPDLPRVEDVRVDYVVVGFALLLALLTGLLFGLAPALQARASAIAEGLRDGSRSDSGRRVARLRPLLVTSEVALALVLLVGAGLLVRSFAALQAVEPGFQTERVLSFRVTAGTARYPEAGHVRRFHAELLERLEAIPGVQAASGITTLLLPRLPNMGSVTIEGQPPAAEGEPTVSVTNDFVEPAFFETMRIPIIRGRDFEAGDAAEGVPVVIVNETFVRRFLPDLDPIGRRFTRGDPESPDAVWQTIVGVAADSRRAGLIEPVRPEAYRPVTQVAVRSLELLVRTAGPPPAVVPQIRAAVRELDPDIPIVQLQTVDQALAEAVATRRFVMLLLVGLAALAVTLAAIGIYGVLAYLVGQRTRELGIRMALGADRPAVLALVLKQSLRHVVPGIALGTAGALALTRLLRAQLYGISPTDPLTFAGVTFLLLLVALLASWAPARRATCVEPLTALRAE